MTPQQISKVWTVINLVLLYYALNTWIVTQGGHEIFGAKLIIEHRVPAAMMGIPICSVLMLIGSLVGLMYANRNGPAWHSRIPVVGFDAISTGSREGKIYQASVFSLITVLPLLALVHFWLLFNSAKLVTTKNPPKEIKNIWDWSALVSLDDPARICTNFNVRPETSTISCDGNITILPGLEPWLFALVTAAAALALLAQWWVVLAPARKRIDSNNFESGK